MYWWLRPWRHAFDFSGRSPRREYWLFVLQFYILIFAPFFIAIPSLRADPFSPGTTGEAVLIGVEILIFLVSFVPGLAVAVRRLHDQNKPGVVLLLGLIPGIGGFILFFFMIYDGDPDENQYGPNPRDRYRVEETTEIFE
jgi:uncharacterized membrane protein YhaH (DUF805 family)